MKSQNPYASPAVRPTKHQDPWWKRFFKFLVGADPFSVTLEAFLAGEIQMLEGIAFFVDPENDQCIYATSASDDYGEQRLSFIVSEVIRLIPKLEVYSHADSQLCDRNLVVGIIHDYSDPKQNFQFAKSTLVELESGNAKVQAIG